jgi:hypothetical protein
MPAFEYTDVVPDEPLRHDPTFRRVVLGVAAVLVLVFMVAIVVLHARVRRSVRAVRASIFAASASRGKGKVE